MVPELRELGPVTLFDFAGDRHVSRHGRRGWERRRIDVNDELFDRVAVEHRVHGIDWVFIYTEGTHLLRRTLRHIRRELGVPTVLMSLDDKQSWELGVVGDQDRGLIDIAGEVDLYWTSARDCIPWVRAVGGRPHYMPEGCDPHFYRPVAVPKRYDVAFVGAAYGFRPRFIQRLRAAGLDVTVFGPGWRKDSCLSELDMVRVVNESRVVLGHGGIGYSETLRNVKGRDFDFPAVGGGVYITTHNPDLALHFEEGREILFYRSDRELLERVQWVLSNDREARHVAERARARCVREHRWMHRFAEALGILGILPLQPQVRARGAEGD
ncbi:glycosyltransferase [Anaeromyxobacter sp. SG17]|uniref:CgeB family protein n=1 Tax=Anaeromyxobacter sp. SG17 TaxID=2925405 RepID=UPI001F55DA7C|nr:glycosyltransferase [Anaeromyxobacter sp. SG17]